MTQKIKYTITASIGLLLVFFIAPYFSGTKEIPQKYINLGEQFFMSPIAELELMKIENEDSEWAGTIDLSENLDNIEVVEHTTLGSWGTAIYIPQNHRYPGTNVADRKNDSAEVAQTQIFEVLKNLHSEYAIDFIMTEGELYGPVEDEKIKNLEQKIALRIDLEDGLSRLSEQMADNELYRGLTKTFDKQAVSVLSSLEREIILAGAPQKLKAGLGEKIILYGSEKDSTREACKEIVRKYVYQQDRLEKCTSENPSPAPAAVQSFDNNNLLDRINEFKNKILSTKPEWTDLLKSLDNKFIYPFEKFSIDTLLNIDLKSFFNRRNTNPLSTIGNTLSHIKARANENSDQAVLSILADIKQTIDTIQANESSSKQLSTAPNRSQNPYQDISDPEELKSMILITEEEIEALVIRQRNLETAEYFAAGLKELDQEIGILQFGAGHEDGLIQELNNQGLNVVVIKVAEIIRREKR